ncbi:hypothetical protein BDZ97DRAFT_1656746, partial [Flammula alnicola]
TAEVLGILPIPDEIRTSGAMMPYVSGLDRNQKHHFLAEMQGTRKPILPVHTSVEKQLFRRLMNSNPIFSPKSGEPRWREAVKVWNSNAERMDDVSYKLVEQLKTYYTKWKSLSHVKETLSLSADLRRPLSLIIHDPLRSTIAPTVPEHPRQPHFVTRGLRDVPADSLIPRTPNLPHDEIPNTNNAFAVGERRNEAQSTAGPDPPSPSMDIDFSSTPSAPAATRTSAGLSRENREQTELLARQQVADSLAKRKHVQVSRKRRTCRKCAKPECGGSQKVANCKNVCRDCKQFNCRGRNPKYLERTCAEGWNV